MRIFPPVGQNLKLTSGWELIFHGKILSPTWPIQVPSSPWTGAPTGAPWKEKKISVKRWNGMSHQSFGSCLLQSSWLCWTVSVWVFMFWPYTSDSLGGWRQNDFYGEPGGYLLPIVLRLHGHLVLWLAIALRLSIALRLAITLLRGSVSKPSPTVTARARHADF